MYMYMYEYYYLRAGVSCSVYLCDFSSTSRFWGALYTLYIMQIVAQTVVNKFGSIVRNRAYWWLCQNCDTCMWHYVHVRTLYILLNICMQIVSTWFPNWHVRYTNKKLGHAGIEMAQKTLVTPQSAWLYRTHPVPRTVQVSYPSNGNNQCHTGITCST